MKKSSLVAQALPVLVGAYARKFGVQVRMQGMTAYTNGTVITIPRLNLDDEKTARFAYAYLAHEAAHVRYTSFRSLMRHRADYLKRTLVNILEDARIERLIGREFIGVWENLELLRADDDSWQTFVQQVTDAETSGTLGITPPVLNLILSTLPAYLASYIQKFTRQRTRAAWCIRKVRGLEFFAPLARRRLLARFLHTARKVGGCENTTEVCRLATELIKLLRSMFSCDDLKIKSPEHEHEQEADAALQAQIKVCSEQRPAISVPGTDFTEQMTRMFDDSSGSRDDFGSMVLGEARAGDEDYARVLDSWAMRTMKQTLRNKALAFVACAKDNEADHGRFLNVTRAQFVRCGETRIFRPRTFDLDPSTDVSILLDCSGSMMSRDNTEHSRLDVATKVALNVAVAFDNIPELKTQVIAFPGWQAECELIKDFNQKALLRARYFHQTPRGSTPMAQALLTAAGRATGAARHVMFIITDGIPDSANMLMRALKSMDDDGSFDIMGVGIKMNFVRSFVPNSTIIEHLAELPDAVGSMFNQYLVRRTNEWRNA